MSTRTTIVNTLINVAVNHAKALPSSLASRASGIFVTSLYGSAAAVGYLVGWIATHAGWTTAGEIQTALLSVVGRVARTPSGEMNLGATHVGLTCGAFGLAIPSFCLLTGLIATVKIHPPRVKGDAWGTLVPWRFELLQQ